MNYDDLDLARLDREINALFDAPPDARVTAGGYIRRHITATSRADYWKQYYNLRKSEAGFMDKRRESKRRCALAAEQ